MIMALLVSDTEQALAHYLMIVQLSITADHCQQKLSGLSTMADDRRAADINSRIVACSAVCLP